MLSTNISAEEYLRQKVQEGSKAAQVLWDARLAKIDESSNVTMSDTTSQHDEPRDNKRKADKKSDETTSRKKSKKKQDGGYGSLFKASSGGPQISGGSAEDKTSGNKAAEEGSDEYWDEQRAKLGLKPLKK